MCALQEHAVLRSELSGTVLGSYSVVQLQPCVPAGKPTCARQKNDWSQHKAECKGIAAIKPHAPTDTMRLLVRALQKRVGCVCHTRLCGWYAFHIAAWTRTRNAMGNGLLEFRYWSLFKPANVCHGAVHKLRHAICYHYGPPPPPSSHIIPY